MARHDHFVLASINRKKVVWWFDAPMARVHSKEITLDLLLFDHRTSVLHHFRVPFSFIRANLKKFDVRNHKVRIELGANPPHLFQDVRSSSGKVDLRRFRHCSRKVRRDG